MISGRPWPRRRIQTICLAGAIVFLWPVLPWAIAPRFFAQVSPFVAFSSAVSARAATLGTIIGLVAAVASSTRKRWFCLYVCPTGFLLENASRTGVRKYSGWTAHCPSIGRFAAVLTFVAAIVGYPVLAWMDPLSMFSAPFAIRSATDVSTALAVCVGLGALFGITFVFGMVWCVRICPLGATQDLLFWLRSMLARGLRGTFPSRLPETGIPVIAGRRAFVAGAFGTVLGTLARKAGAARGEEAPLRPPGSIDEERFTGVCIRCDNCVRVCPSKIIRPDLGKAGFAGLLAPVIQYDKDRYCLEDCNLCTQVCPSGALQPLDMPHKQKHIIGEALVDASLCLLTLGKKDCDACKRSCPFDAIHIVWDEQQYIAYPAVDATKCNGCGACEVVCPARPNKAIGVWTASPSPRA